MKAMMQEQRAEAAAAAPGQPGDAGEQVRLSARENLARTREHLRLIRMVLDDVRDGITLVRRELAGSQEGVEAVGAPPSPEPG